MAKILIYSPSHIGKSMAGAAIRSWEFAKALAQNHRVILITPDQVGMRAEGFEIVPFSTSKVHFQDADILVTQRLTLPLALWTTYYHVKVVIDAYDPSPFEHFELDKGEPLTDQSKRIESEISNLIFSFKMADGILCASERQRELWIGFLLAQKLITPSLYQKDPSYRSFIDVVPFGLSHTPPQKNGKGLREMLGLDVHDKILLWGGGIWNWFDPLTMIRAMKIVCTKGADIKLVFMGVKPPDPTIPIMSMVDQSIALASQLEIINKWVYFHHEWIPYEERQNFLLDADVGVSTHSDHLETHFSFRTRILDYLWAQLPILATEGDEFAKLIAQHDLGIVVPFNDPQAIADGVLSLFNHPSKLGQIKENLNRVREKFYWQSLLTPLQDMIERLTFCQQTYRSWKNRAHLMTFLMTKIREKGISHCLRKASQPFISRR